MKGSSFASFTKGHIRSPLMEAMTLGPNKRKNGAKKKLAAVLILTSLVDAFCIILLYLLVQNTGNGSTIELNKAEKLPVAVKTEALHSGAIVRVERNRYFFDEKQIDPAQLASRLQEIRAGRTGADAGSLIIQADRSVSFNSLAPVIRAGSVSGFHKFKFAVLQAEGNL